MRRAIFAALAVALLCAPARSQFIGEGVWKAVASAGYTGPLDAVSGAKAYWSLRAASAATRGNRLINVCNSTGGVDVGCADMVSDATTGNLVSQTISGIPCPGTNCTIKIWYDQSGALACGGAACDLSQGTVGSRATLTASCIGSLPCASFVRASNQTYANSGFGAQAQPITIAAVAERTGTTTSTQAILATNGASDPDVFFDTANTVGIFSGTANISHAATDSTQHAIIGIANGASSVISIDNASTSGNAGASGISNAIIQLGVDNFGNHLDGRFMEGGYWFIAFNGTQQSNWYGNVHPYWSTP